MVEMEKEYILQWSGHAERITEKLRHYVSNQALVDVTLLCQDEKLRVHKLVLAATSEYFEELLEQDLGQEPIILLKDLNFDILKAMVEFMYCGETTIAHCHLQSLLDAAQLFKIKDLESIVNFMMMDDNKTEEESNTQEEDYDCSSAKSNIDSNTDVADDGTCVNNLFDDTILKTNDNCDDVSSDNERSHDIKILINDTDSTNELITSESTSQSDSNSDNDNDEDEDDDEDNEDDTKLINSHLDCHELSSEVGECLKVYSHKKRTSIDSKTNSMMIDKYPDPISSSSSSSSNELATNCIDLSCDTKCDTTLPSTLEMQVTDNIWNLGKFINDKNKNTNDDLFKMSDFSTHRKINELFSISSCNISNKRPPVLRRSVRLNNNDDTINNNNINNNNNNSELNNLKKKVFIKKNFNLKTLKSKRKNKESDENNINLRKPVNNNNNNSRSLRSTSKLIKKTNSYNKIVKDDKTKTISSSSTSSSSSSSSSSSLLNKNNETFVPMKLNTIASVDRSLWGDMSDVIEYSENNNNNNNNNILNEYSSSKEIPFALGLLPLRAALERMQAALDYQPRKTRSSVAPTTTTTKFDTNNTSKRKTNSSSDSDTGSPKKQINTEFIDNCTNIFHKNIINELSSQQIHHHHHHHHHHINAIINHTTPVKR